MTPEAEGKAMRQGDATWKGYSIGITVQNERKVGKKSRKRRDPLAWVREEIRFWRRKTCALLAKPLWPVHRDTKKKTPRKRGRGTR